MKTERERWKLGKKILPHKRESHLAWSGNLSLLLILLASYWGLLSRNDLSMF